MDSYKRPSSSPKSKKPIVTITAPRPYSSELRTRVAEVAATGPSRSSIVRPRSPFAQHALSELSSHSGLPDAPITRHHKDLAIAMAGVSTSVPLTQENIATWEQHFVAQAKRQGLPKSRCEFALRCLAMENKTSVLTIFQGTSVAIQNLRSPGMAALLQQLDETKDALIGKLRMVYFQLQCICDGTYRAHRNQLESCPEVLKQPDDTMCLTRVFLENCVDHFLRYMMLLDDDLSASPQIPLVQQELDTVAAEAPPYPLRILHHILKWHSAFCAFLSRYRSFDATIATVQKEIERMEEEHDLFSQALSQGSPAVQNIQVVTLKRMVNVSIKPKQRDVYVSTSEECKEGEVISWVPSQTQCMGCKEYRNEQDEPVDFSGSQTKSQPENPLRALAKTVGVMCPDCQALLTQAHEKRKEEELSRLNPPKSSEKSGRDKRKEDSSTRLNALRPTDKGSSVSLGSMESGTAHEGAGEQSIAVPEVVAAGASILPEKTPSRPSLEQSSGKRDAKSTMAPPRGKPSHGSSSKAPVNVPHIKTPVGLTGCSVAVGPDAPIRVESRGAQTNSDDKTTSMITAASTSLSRKKGSMSCVPSTRYSMKPEAASDPVVDTEMRSMEEALRRTSQEGKHVEIKLQACQEQLEESKRTIEQLHTSQSSLHTLLAANQASMAALSTQHGELNKLNEIHALKKALLDTGDNLGKSRQECNSLANALENTRSQVLSLQNEIKKLQQSYLVLRNDGDRAGTALRIQDKTISRLMREHESLQTAIHMLMKFPDPTVGTVDLSKQDEEFVQHMIAANTLRIQCLEQKNDEWRQWRFAKDRPNPKDEKTAYSSFHSLNVDSLSMRGTPPKSPANSSSWAQMRMQAMNPTKPSPIRGTGDTGSTHKVQEEDTLPSIENLHTNHERSALTGGVPFSLDSGLDFTPTRNAQQRRSPSRLGR